MTVLEGAVRLAGRRPFELGGLRVQPGTREVICEAAIDVLEPRVMQVLVALAQKRVGGPDPRVRPGRPGAPPLDAGDSVPGRTAR